MTYKSTLHAQVRVPEAIERILTDFVEAARASLGADLRSIVLYGSAAEGKLRQTSDVNVIVVLATFDPEKVDRLRDPLRTAYAAVRLTTMFLLENEVAAAVDAFAVKFADVRHRHQVLFGTDPFATAIPSRSAEISRLKQVLLNLTLRLRQTYILRSLRDEQAAIIVADMAGPIRACAEALLELEGTPAASPKEALEKFAARLSGLHWRAALERMSEARETRSLPPGVGPPTVLKLIDLLVEMRTQVDALK